MEEQQHKSWFKRNWKWAVPVGGCLTLIILGVLGIFSLIFGVTKMFTSSEPYEYAMEHAKNNPEVINILGAPIESDGIINGNISLRNNDGEADFSIPIKGSSGEGNIIVVAEKKDGTWFYEKLYVQIKSNQEQINLLEKELEHI